MLTVEARAEGRIAEVCAAAHEATRASALAAIDDGDGEEREEGETATAAEAAAVAGAEAAAVAGAEAAGGHP